MQFYYSCETTLQVTLEPGNGPKHGDMSFRWACNVRAARYPRLELKPSDPAGPMAEAYMVLLFNLGKVGEHMMCAHSTSSFQKNWPNKLACGEKVF